MSTEADAFLAGNAATKKFANIGDKVVGTVLRYELRQEHEYSPKGGKGKPKFFESGDPIPEIVMTLQTDECDPSLDNDDGRRNVYIKGKRAMEEIRRVVSESGMRGRTLVGAKFGMVFTEVGVPAGAGLSPPKIYRMKLEPGEPVVEPIVNDDPFDDGGWDEPI